MNILNKIGICNYWKWKLNDDYVFENKYFDGLDIDYEWASVHDGKLTIYAGYAWNGCSPKKSYWSLFVIGTPDGTIEINTGKQKAYYASLVHDCLYQYKIINRKHADKIFLELLRKSEFLPAKLYYLAVRLFGKEFKPNKYI